MSAEQEDCRDVLPAGAPPLLTASQVTELCSKGWLDYELPERLQDDIDRMHVEAAEFFKQDEWQKLQYTALKQPHDEGYYLVPDEKEYMTFRRELSKQFALQDSVRDIWPQVAALLHRMLCDMSRAGGLDPSAWDQVIANTLMYPRRGTSLLSNPTLLRLFRYDASTGTADKHTDLGLLTMCVGTGAGLEVLDPDSHPAEWKGTARCTVLVGECLRKLSSNNIHAGVHRVVANPLGRQSLVFALRPNLSRTVDLELFGGSGSVDLKSLFRSIKATKYNVNARQDERQKQIQEQNAISEQDLLDQEIRLMALQ